MLDHLIVKQRLLDIQIVTGTYVHPVESLHKCHLENGTHTYLSFALNHLKKNELTMRVNSKMSVSQDYAIDLALAHTPERKYAKDIMKAGIFRYNELPTNTSESSLAEFIGKYKQMSNMMPSTLMRIINTIKKRLPRGRIPIIEQLDNTKCDLIPASWDKVTIYTDGGYNPTKNVATFGIVVDESDNGINIKSTKRCENSRIPGKQDNYRAELYGILRALMQVHDHQTVIIKTDSQSSIDAVLGFVNTTNEGRIMYNNKMLLDSIRKEYNRINKVVLKYVEAHCGEPGNERADKLATEAMKHRRININVLLNSNDDFVMQYNNESCFNVRVYLKEHITSNHINDKNYDFDLLKESYHKISSQCFENMEFQTYLAKARSNQLATNSKQHKWSNGIQDKTCPRCNEHNENQLHLLHECKYNQQIYLSTARKVLKYCNEHKHHKGVTKPLNIYGIPYSIYNQSIAPRTMKNNKNFRDYRWKLGLITREEATITAKAGYKKPGLLINKIVSEIITMSKDIWNLRNKVVHSS